MIIVCPSLFKLFFNDNFNAIALYPFIIIKKEALRHDQKLIRHEQIHLRQQVELLVIFFYLWYLIEFLGRILMSQSFEKAYRAISFEQEAYSNETDVSYLNKRPFWAHLNWI